jgi:hypothetical protein
MESNRRNLVGSRRDRAMAITRRTFLKVSAATGAGTILNGYEETLEGSVARMHEEMARLR